jgi:hypothetical protein
MIVAIDVTTLRGRISGVGYYTARIVEHLAAGYQLGVWPAHPANILEAGRSGGTTGVYP